MQQKKIKYIGFYDFKHSIENRVCNIAATNKMNYIASALVEAGYSVEFVSPSWMGANSKVKYQKQKTIHIEENICVTFCPSWITNNKLTRNLKIFISLIWLFLYLLFNVKKDEKVLAYHVQWISSPIRTAKFFKRFKLVLEVEEIFQDVMVINSLFTKWENKLIDAADTFLFSTDLLNKKIGKGRQYVVIYGEYKKTDRIYYPPEDGKIHLLYAGIIDSHKKGAYNALEASRYLSDKYILHIIGFGEVDELSELIKQYNETNECKIMFDGEKAGDNYVMYCQMCHIGLSTQSMDGVYLESSFPSKILSYMSLGLKVVSCHIDCISQSKIGEYVTYYYQDDPRSIAKAIESVDNNSNVEISNIIQDLHNNFITDIKVLIG